MTLTTIELAWPHKHLSQNARVHWSVRSRLAKSARIAAAWSAKAAGADKVKAEALELTISFMPPDRRRRDLDGMLSSLKSAIDGIADVVGVDDSKFNLTIRRANPIKGGLVVVTIEPAGAR